jgi:hypothetical protein
MIQPGISSISSTAAVVNRLTIALKHYLQAVFPAEFTTKMPNPD